MIDRPFDAYDAVLSDSERAFRSAVIDVLREAERDGLLTPHQFFEGRGEGARQLYQVLGQRGWLNQCWPEAHGGTGAPLAHEFLMWDTLAYYRAAKPDLGPGLIAHVLIDAGSAELQGRILPGIADGTTAFCLGYSEPEAGSDLTHLRTKATRVGDDYVIRGHKMWTSESHHAQLIWLLCRVGDEPGRRGLTLFVVDIDSPGITVSAIPTIDRHRTNEVFLDDVRVPAANLVGEEGGAWRLMRGALAVERLTQVLPGRLRRDVELFEERAAVPASVTGSTSDGRQLSSGAGSPPSRPVRWPPSTPWPAAGTESSRAPDRSCWPRD